MILLTSSSIPSSAMSNAGGREWVRMGGILHGAVHGAWQIFRFQSPSETKLIKNCHLPSWFKKHASWFRKLVSWYMTWNTWELKVNSTILTHSKSKLMLILSILIVNWWIWIIKLHLWYFVTFGVAYFTVLGAILSQVRAIKAFTIVLSWNPSFFHSYVKLLSLRWQITSSFLFKFPKEKQAHCHVFFTGRCHPTSRLTKRGRTAGGEIRLSVKIDIFGRYVLPVGYIFKIWEWQWQCHVKKQNIERKL